MDPGENKILGCRFGTDASGNAVRETSVGVQIDSSPKNQIGGDKEGEANIIHAKDLAVKIEGEGADENTIFGNRIGIGVDGNVLKPLAGGGVYIERGDRNVVGGDGTQGNRIACETSVSAGGVHKITELDILGNRIGLDAAGVNAGGGSYGIALFGAKENELTGVKIAKNKIAGSFFNVLGFGGDGGLSDVDIEDNEIGLRFDGSGKLPSGAAESHLYGIRLDAVSKANLRRNVVTGHAWNILVAGNIQLFAEGEDTDGDGENDSWAITALTPENPDGDDEDEFKAQDVKIENNTIGLNRTDKVPEGAEQTAGVATFGLAGRTTIRNNTIAGHKGNQVWLQDGAGHVVSGNTIGTPDGSSVGSQVGVFIQNTERATIALANVISGNEVAGILITGKAGNTTIQGNRIGTSRSGNESWPNKVGIAILEVENNNGEVDSPLGIDIVGNTISGNTNEGVSIDLSGFVDVKGNRIGVGLDGGPLPNAVGVSFEGGNGTLVENVIAHNRLSGVAIPNDSSKVRILSSSIYANGGGLGIAGIAYDDAPIDPPSKVVGLRSAPDAFGIVRLTFAISAQDEEAQGAAVLEIFGNPMDSERQGQQFLFSKLIDPAEPFFTTIEVPANSPMAAVKNFTATLTMDGRTSAFSKHTMAEAIVWPEIDIAESDAPGQITLSWPDSPHFRLETFSSAIPHWRESDAIITKVGGVRKATVAVRDEFEFEMFRLALDEEALLTE